MSTTKHSWAMVFWVTTVMFFVFQGCYVYFEYNDMIKEYEENAITISSIVSKSIDIDEYKKIVRSQEKNYYYKKMQSYFSNIKTSTDIAYLYVEREVDEKTIEYIFDADSDALGEKDINLEHDIYMFGKKFMLGKNHTYKWGSLVTSYSPIKDNGKIIGLVGVDYTLSNVWSHLKLNMMHSFLYCSISFAFFAFFVLITIKLYSKNETAMMEFYRNAVGSLAISLSKKSDYTWKHSLRVADFSELIAKELGISEKNIETIKWAATLHDIGKIGIPEEILNKTDRLTNEEFEIIKSHSTHGKEILGGIFKSDNSFVSQKEFEIIADIAEFHHERWDGTGYPSKLKGEDIPLYARIVAIADAFEAMTAERPYKSSMTYSLALNELKRNKGTQFDSHIVDAFEIALKKTYKNQI